MCCKLIIRGEVSGDMRRKRESASVNIAVTMGVYQLSKGSMHLERNRITSYEKK